jgi:RND superfamily putative drug exporter
VAALPHVLGTSDLVSPDGRVALIRIQYPERAELSPADLGNLKTTLDDLRDSTELRIEAGGDLYFAFEQAPTGVGEALGLAVAIVILLLAFGSVVAMGCRSGPHSSAWRWGQARCPSWRTSSTSPAGRS